MAEKMLFDRALYKKVKNMDRAAMEQTFKNVYEIGYKPALKETSSVLLDTDALRADIGRVKGIGDKRLDEIMSIIEIHLTKSGKTE